VPQEVHLIDDTLRRNIALGRADAEIDGSAVAEALRRAQLDRFVTSLPEGLDTRVGDRGVRLSGGERQRTGIARALYNRPSVLILDEATSALDPQTEAAILGALRAESSGSTLIAVTHRLHGVREFDQVVFVHHGRIHGVGTYDALSAAHPEFRQLAAQQAGTD
jgi:ABC-type multidrug transport system fused ATPase/permease subunit